MAALWVLPNLGHFLGFPAPKDRSHFFVNLLPVHMSQFVNYCFRLLLGSLGPMKMLYIFPFLENSHGISKYGLESTEVHMEYQGDRQDLKSLTRGQFFFWWNQGVAECGNCTNTHNFFFSLRQDQPPIIEYVFSTIYFFFLTILTWKMEFFKT